VNRSSQAAEPLSPSNKKSGEMMEWYTDGNVGWACPTRTHRWAEAHPDLDSRFRGNRKYCFCDGDELKPVERKYICLDQLYRRLYRRRHGFALGVAYGEFPVP